MTDLHEAAENLRRAEQELPALADEHREALARIKPPMGIRPEFVENVAVPLFAVGFALLFLLGLIP